MQNFPRKRIVFSIEYCDSTASDKCKPKNEILEFVNDLELAFHYQKNVANINNVKVDYPGEGISQSKDLVRKEQVVALSTNLGSFAQANYDKFSLVKVN